MGIYTNTAPGANTYQALLSDIDGIDLGDYAIRGLVATLTPIPNSGLKRSVNGTLLDWTMPQFEKFAVQISCDDLDPPTLTGIWQGALITPTFDSNTLGVSNQTDGSLKLECMLDSWNVTHDDYGRAIGWQLNLLEI